MIGRCVCRGDSCRPVDSIRRGRSPWHTDECLRSENSEMMGPGFDPALPSHLHEEPTRGFGNQVGCENNILPSESANRPHNLQQISGIARSGGLALVVELLVQEVQAGPVERDISLL